MRQIPHTCHTHSDWLAQHVLRVTNHHSDSRLSTNNNDRSRVRPLTAARPLHTHHDAHLRTNHQRAVGAGVAAKAGTSACVARPSLAVASQEATSTSGGGHRPLALHPAQSVSCVDGVASTTSEASHEAAHVALRSDECGSGDGCTGARGSSARDGDARGGDKGEDTVRGGVNGDGKARGGEVGEGGVRSGDGGDGDARGGDDGGGDDGGGTTRACGTRSDGDAHGGSMSGGGSRSLAASRRVPVVETRLGGALVASRRAGGSMSGMLGDTGIVVRCADCALALLRLPARRARGELGGEGG
jgi:hypothetical protein